MTPVVSTGHSAAEESRGLEECFPVTSLPATSAAESPAETRRCPECRRELIGMAARARYCSSSCQRVAYRRGYQAKHPEPKKRDYSYRHVGQRQEPDIEESQMHWDGLTAFSTLIEKRYEAKCQSCARIVWEGRMAKEWVARYRAIGGWRCPQAYCGGRVYLEDQDAVGIGSPRLVRSSIYQPGMAMRIRSGR